MAAGEWRDVILHTLRETPSKKEGKTNEGYGMWVVARVKPDGSIFGVTVRSGRYYPNKLDGSKTVPKEGMGYYDFMELKKKSKVLTESMKGCPSCGVAREPTVWDEVVKFLDPKNPPKLPDFEPEQQPDPEPSAPAEPELPDWMK